MALRYNPPVNGIEVALALKLRTGIILRTHGVPTTTTTVDAGWQGRWMVSGVDTETNVQQYYTKIYPLLIFPK
jgi:hypothetical protein